MFQTESIRAFCRFFDVKSIINTKIQSLKNVKFKELKYAGDKINSLYKNLEKLEKIRNTNPVLYNLIAKGYKSGELEDNAFKIFMDFIDNPIEDYRTGKAVYHYKNEGYKFMNTFLRTGKVRGKYPDGSDVAVSQDYKVKIKREVKILSDYIKGRSFNLPVTLYRGDDYICLSGVVIKDGKFKGQKLSDVLLSLEKMPEKERMETLKEINSQSGLVINNKAFLSTSFSKKGAKTNKPIFLTLTNKEPIKGICADTIVNPHIKELEFLIQKGSKAYIKDIRPGKDNRWYIKATIKT